MFFFYCLFLASSVAWTPQAIKSFSVHSLQGKNLSLEALKRDKRKTLTWVGLSQAEAVRGNSLQSGGKEGRKTKKKALEPWQRGGWYAYRWLEDQCSCLHSLGSLCSSLTTKLDKLHINCYSLAETHFASSQARTYSYTGQHQNDSVHWDYLNHSVPCCSSVHFILSIKFPIQILSSIGQIPDLCMLFKANNKDTSSIK